MKQLKKSGFFDLVKKHGLVGTIVVFAFVANLSLTVFNGLYVCSKGSCGIYLGNLHYHDFLWHYTLAANAFSSFPFRLPIFSGAGLQGYNFLIDLVLFLLSQAGISVISAYFVILPVFYMILLTVLTYVFLKNRNENPLYIASGLFFVFFGSSFSYLLSLYHFHTLKSFTYSQAMQSGRALLNMPYAWSIPVLLGAMIILQKEKLSGKRIFILGLFLFLMFGLKFYGGAVLALFILAARLPLWLRVRKPSVLLEWLSYGMGTGLAYLIFYRAQGPLSGFPFAFSPLAIAHPLVEEKDMFYLPSLVNARYFLSGAARLSPRLLAIELFTAAVFIFYNLGSRFIGLFAVAAGLWKKKLSRIDLALLVTVAVATLTTLLFVQKREWWNIIQFMGYALFFMNFFAGDALFFLAKSRKPLLIALAAVAVLLTLPSNIEQLTYAGERFVSINQEELDALSFLKRQGPGTVLALPVQETSYVGAFSRKQEYIADKTQLYLLGVRYEKRMEEANRKSGPVFDRRQVEYLYVKKDSKRTAADFPGYARVFQNNEVTIYRKI